ncbi:hypothetical protein BH10PSE10_BH10PSE10_18900 [soil metagenome]
MTISASLPSAKIYQFPVGGRRGLPPGSRAESKPATEQPAPRTPITGWYHEAAIEDAKRGREH